MEPLIPVVKETAERGVHPIRFGVMADGGTVSDWQMRCIEALLELEGVELALLIVNASDNGVTPSRVLKAGLNTVALEAYHRLAGFKSGKPRRLCGAPTIRCRTVMRGRHSQHFTDEDVAAIRSHSLDFILRFGFGIIRGGILSAAKYGVWSYHHGDEEKYRGGPPGFWEIYRGDPVNGAILQRLTSRLDGGVILRKGYFPTNLDSYRDHRDYIYYGAAGWAAQVVKDIRNSVAEYLDGTASPTDAPIYRAPSPLQLAGMATQTRLHQLKRLAAPQQQWSIGVVRGSVESFLDPSYSPRVDWYPVEPGRFLADPFGVETDEGLRILAEDYSFADMKQRLSCLSYRDGAFSRPVTCFDPPYNVAYPYIVQHGGSTYCIPETLHGDEVAIYRLSDDWTLKKEGVLLEGVRGVDPTVVRFNGAWWMFLTINRRGSTHDLHIYHSNDLFGPWEEHLNNPVKTDVRSARSAGTPFTSRGVLYRPAMDCSDGYGRRVVLNRVEKLTDAEFRETSVGEVHPNGDYPEGRHTLSSAGSYTLVDGHRNIRNAHYLINRLREVRQHLST